jgi:hypothetical protein
MPDGLLTFTVWPTHVGVTDAAGCEPWDDLDYTRAQIRWATAGDALYGSAGPILLPAGEFTHLVFAHHPASPLLLAVTPLAHPFRFYTPGNSITLARLELADFTTRAEQPMDTLARIAGHAVR